MKLNSGSYPAMVTPYNNDGSVNLASVKKLAEWYFDGGCHGIFAICQSSEIFFLSLEERVEILRAVIETRDRLFREKGRYMSVIASGHISESLREQAEELCAVAAEKPDALVLITNRLADENESDDVWITNAEKLISQLPYDIPLGLYECPYPYKRLATEKTLDWVKSTNRFSVMKDTCCDASEIARRVKQLEGTGFLLLNANCQTLLQSLRSGASGYCGIMANFHPKLYSWLCDDMRHFDDEPKKAELVQSFLCISGFIENGLQTYPTNAKYNLMLEGIPSALVSRSRKNSMTEYDFSCVDQLRALQKLFIGDVMN